MGQRHLSANRRVAGGSKRFFIRVFDVFRVPNFFFHDGRFSFLCLSGISWLNCRIYEKLLDRMKKYETHLASVLVGGAICLTQLYCPFSHAGTFSSDFNSGKPAGVSVYGSATVETTGGVGGSGVLKLTTNKNNLQGALVIGDLDAGAPIGSFSATFKMRIGGGTGADGLSFNFAPTLPKNAFGEEGAGSGLTISFDTADNGNGEGPAIDVKFGGALIASKRITPRTGAEYANVAIKVDPDGSLDLVFGNTVVFTNIFAYSPVSGLFGIGARTGGFNDNHFIDDLAIRTTPAAGPFVKSISPRGNNVPPDAPILFELQDSGRQVNPDSVKVVFNGIALKSTASKEVGLTTVQAPRSGVLPSGSFNQLRIEFADTSVPPVTTVGDYEFQVSPYLTIPSIYALGVSSIDTNRIGFTIHTVQARNDANLPATVARAEAQLAGTLIDPLTGQPFKNEAAVGTNPDKSFAEGFVINYEQEKIPIGQFLDLEAAIPGIPGPSLHTDNAAMEILTYLALPAGYHKFGVNSDDGFKLTMGPIEARDAFATVVGEFDGQRSAGDTVFSIVTETAGYYPCRLLWFQGRGGASLEFFSILNDGTRILINDRSVTNSIRVFREVKPTVPALPYVVLASPRPNEVNVGLKPQISITIKDQRSLVVSDSIQLTLNGVAISPKVTKASGVTTINYQPATPLLYASTNTLLLTYRDDATPANQLTRQWQFTTTRKMVPTGQWDFEAGNLAATVGQALEFGDTVAKEVSAQTQFGTTTSFGIPDLGGTQARVMRFKRSSSSAVLQPGYLVKHGISPNGGGTLVNRWTLVMDIFFPEPQESRYTSLIQIDDLNSDADMFVRWNNIGGEGTGGLGVDGQFTGDGRTFLTKGRWHRIALAADLTSDSPMISKFVDGVKFEDQYISAPQVDGRFALGKSVRLFSDENNELSTFYVNSIQILDGKMLDEDIAALGGPSVGGISGTVVVPPASSPTLSARWAGTSLQISWPTDVAGYSLESSDSPASSTWATVTGVTNNSATIRIDTKARFFRLRR